MSRRTFKLSILGILVATVMVILAKCLILSIQLFFKLFLIMIQNPLEVLASILIIFSLVGIYSLLKKVSQNETI